eukprot:10937371-Heterocapsa_arctica.AAC.2
MSAEGCVYGLKYVNMRSPTCASHVVTQLSCSTRNCMDIEDFSNLSGKRGSPHELGGLWTSCGRGYCEVLEEIIEEGAGTPLRRRDCGVPRGSRRSATWTALEALRPRRTATRG